MKLFVLAALFFLVIVFPRLEAEAYRKLMERLETDPRARVRIYREACSMTWGIALTLLAAVAWSHTPAAAIGFKNLDFSRFLAWPIWQKTLASAVLALYVTYHILPVLYPILGGRLRSEVGKRLEYVVDIVPVDREERWWWAATAFSAPLEELIYRGFCFYAILLWWPSAPLVIVALLASLVDALRYVHRPRAGMNIFAIGLVFSLLFVMCGSIWVPMLTHLLQDIRVLAFPIKTIRRNIAERAAAAQATPALAAEPAGSAAPLSASRLEGVNA
jgi:membrane protease YdiL (CAAX protease family)